eukprot:TRINITY_DN3924_c0_g1_i4.p2 TRINITY_DN3924_c0_g1~~TRINITY_DN3924_c0_g1_i4.p2  ORF type:complete len:288 (+),score=19.59 TRINITY_DN3924_c0_g1_i4:345-1208(+)
MTIETSAHIMIKMSKTRNKNANKQQKLCLQIEVKININSTKMAPKGINPPKRQILNLSKYHGNGGTSFGIGLVLHGFFIFGFLNPQKAPIKTKGKQTKNSNVIKSINTSVLTVYDDSSNFSIMLLIISIIKFTPGQINPVKIAHRSQQLPQSILQIRAEQYPAKQPLAMQNTMAIDTSVPRRCSLRKPKQAKIVQRIAIRVTQTPVPARDAKNIFLFGGRNTSLYNYFHPLSSKISSSFYTNSKYQLISFPKVFFIMLAINNAKKEMIIKEQVIENQWIDSSPKNLQ